MEKFINLLRKIRRFDYSTVKISDRENFLPGEKIRHILPVMEFLQDNIFIMALFLKF